MKSIHLILLSLAAIAAPLQAQDFDKHFADSTLRLDYIFGGRAGQDARCSLMLDGASRTPGWAGRPQGSAGCGNGDH